MLLRIWDVTFTVSNLEQAVIFYENVLGLSKKYHYPNNYAGFDCGGVEIGLVPGNPLKVQEGIPCVDFLVQDIEEVYQCLRERGVHFTEEPHDTAWGGKIASFNDPDGNLLQLVQINWARYFAVSAPK